MKKLFLFLVPGVLCLGQALTVASGGGYFPVLIRLKNGELMAVLRGGAPHIGVKGRLDLVRSKDDGKTWSKPWTVVDGPEDDRNPALGQLRDGTLAMAFATLSGYEADGLKRGERKFDGVFVMRSQNGGKTWTKPEKAEATSRLHKEAAALSPFGKIVQLADGTALMAVYYTVSGSGEARHFES